MLLNAQPCAPCLQVDGMSSARQQRRSEQPVQHPAIVLEGTLSTTAASAASAQAQPPPVQKTPVHAGHGLALAGAAPGATVAMQVQPQQQPQQHHQQQQTHSQPQVGGYNVHMDSYHDRMSGCRQPTAVCQSTPASGYAVSHTTGYCCGQGIGSNFSVGGGVTSDGGGGSCGDGGGKAPSGADRGHASVCLQHGER